MVGSTTFTGWFDLIELPIGVMHAVTPSGEHSVTAEATMDAANPGHDNNPHVAEDPIATVSSDDGEMYPVYGIHFDGSDQ